MKVTGFIHYSLVLQTDTASVRFKHEMGRLYSVLTTLTYLFCKRNTRKSDPSQMSRPQLGLITQKKLLLSMTSCNATALGHQHSATQVGLAEEETAVGACPADVPHDRQSISSHKLTFAAAVRGQPAMDLRREIVTRC